MIAAEVLVRHVPGGCLFVCRLDPQGWRCGCCLRGNLGFLPKRRRRCRVCKSFVAAIRPIDTTAKPNG